MACPEAKINHSISLSGIADEEQDVDRDEEHTPTRVVRINQLDAAVDENPTPIEYLHQDEEIFEEYLSPRKLQSLTGHDNLDEVKYLEMRVNTTDSTLGNFGIWLPSLKELKLTNSIISSVRDLGTSLSNLQILWMPRCSLTDLDGISCLSSLKELYLAYNNLNDISPISMLENLEVLDIEGNNINCSSQIGFLTLCPALTALILDGNPICYSPTVDATQEEVEEYNYRYCVKSILPSIKYLDNELINQIDVGYKVEEQVKESNLLIDQAAKTNTRTSDDNEEQFALSPRKHSSISSNRTPTPEMPARPKSAMLTRSVSDRTTSPPLIDRMSSTSPLLIGNDDSSSLTHGSSEVICGNPVRALRSRKKNQERVPRSMELFDSDKSSTNSIATLYSSTPSPSQFQPEHTYEDMNEDLQSKEEVITDLRTWKEQYEKITQGIDVMKMTAIQESEAEESSNAKGVQIVYPTPPPVTPKKTNRPRTASDFRIRRFKKELRSQAITLTSRSYDASMSNVHLHKSSDDESSRGSGNFRVHSATVKQENESVDLVERPATRAGFHRKTRSEHL